MAFKAPKGDIFGWSIFWFLCGLLLAIGGPLKGDYTLGITGSLLVAAATLIWFDQKWIAPPMMLYFGLGAIARGVALVTKGVTLYSVMRFLLPLSFIYIVWEWYRSEREVLEPLTVDDVAGREPMRKARDPFAVNSPFDKSRDDDHSSNPYLGNRPDER